MVEEEAAMKRILVAQNYSLRMCQTCQQDACVLETPVMTLTATIMAPTTLSWSSCFAYIITFNAQTYEEGTLTVLTYR